jgi:hypothetical protein
MQIEGSSKYPIERESSLSGADLTPQASQPAYLWSPPAAFMTAIMNQGIFEEFTVEDALATHRLDEDIGLLRQRFMEAGRKELQSYDTACRILVGETIIRAPVSWSGLTFFKNDDFPLEWYRECMGRITLAANETFIRPGMFVLPPYPYRGV